MTRPEEERPDAHFRTDRFLSDLGVTSFDLCLGAINEGAAGQGGRLEIGKRILSAPYQDLSPIGKSAWGVGVSGIGVGSEHFSKCSAASPCAARAPTGCARC